MWSKRGRAGENESVRHSEDLWWFLLMQLLFMKPSFSHNCLSLKLRLLIRFKLQHKKTQLNAQLLNRQLCIAGSVPFQTPLKPLNYLSAFQWISALYQKNNTTTNASGHIFSDVNDCMFQAFHRHTPNRGWSDPPLCPDGYLLTTPWISLLLKTEAYWLVGLSNSARLYLWLWF